MKKENQIEEKIKEFVWNHPAKIVFILGFVSGFILKSIF